MATVNGAGSPISIPAESSWNHPLVPKGEALTLDWKLLSELVWFPGANTNELGRGAVEANLKYQVSDAYGNFKDPLTVTVPLLTAPSGWSPEAKSVAHSVTIKNENGPGNRHSQIRYWVEAKDKDGNPSIRHEPRLITLQMD